MSRRLPRWARLILGAACVALGVVLTLRPFTSLGVLVVLVAGSFVASGVTELWTVRDAARPALAVTLGLAWVAAGALLLAWAGITIHALAIVAGISMVAGGTVRLTGVLRDRAADRVTAALTGVAGVVGGGLALSWPDLTVLALAVFVGVRTVLFGAGQMLSAVWPRRPASDQRRPPGRLVRGLRLAGASVALVLALGLLAVSLVLHRASPRPDAFYSVPSRVPDRPGALLRSQPFSRGIPADARAWRILYTTTRGKNQPAVASGLVVVTRDPPPGPRPVIAWAHGTAGVDRNCAPSLLPSRFNAHVIPALHQVIQRGWVLVATDYIGLGTPGPHPYLIGQGEARSVLDAVRAAKQIPHLTLADRTVVWGHSQGGHAALWAGMIAPTYAPDVHVVGVAAISPASDLPALVTKVRTTLEGRVLGAYILSAYSEWYPDVSFDRYVLPAARVLVREMARRCLDIPEAIPSVLVSIAARRDPFSANLLGGGLGARLRQNTPTGAIHAPLLIAQGLFDPLVVPSIQEAYVRARCAAGQRLQYHLYEGRDHLSILAPGSPLVGDLLSWTQARLQDEPEKPGCTTTTSGR